MAKTERLILFEIRVKKKRKDKGRSEEELKGRNII
ncbi:hypothetical protein CCACVL1_15413 [Corchorus capsularis]|uniref:Uncharacterized protein n=1 Tax=Corchorus capsularis TaxID=210143 RepID=A0A1R3I2J5_COCAP|nr:hypothetical protein CCACVL1_15413 [Corchorus capsularis]